ncbi:hypothetical protein RFI_38878, partial [Reticulomyxa filosa]
MLFFPKFLFKKKKKFKKKNKRTEITHMVVNNPVLVTDRKNLSFLFLKTLLTSNLKKIDMTNTPTPKEGQVSELPNNKLLFEKVAKQFYTNWSPPKRVVKEYRAEKIPVYDISNITYEIFVCFVKYSFQNNFKYSFKNNLKYYFYKRNISNDWNITKDWLNSSTKTESLLNTNYVKTKFGDAT